VNLRGTPAARRDHRTTATDTRIRPPARRPPPARDCSKRSLRERALRPLRITSAVPHSRPTGKCESPQRAAPRRAGPIPREGAGQPTDYRNRQRSSNTLRRPPRCCLETIAPRPQPRDTGRVTEPTTPREQRWHRVGCLLHPICGRRSRRRRFAVRDGRSRGSSASCSPGGSGSAARRSRFSRWVRAAVRR
jgi:hypothetical protein